MKVKEYRHDAGLTQKQFSELFGIPLDVVKSWDSGRRKPPGWAEKLIIEKLIRIKFRWNGGNMKYAVETFDGISGEGEEFESLEDAKKYFESQKKYYSDNGYEYEFIELFSLNEETGEKIETIEIKTVL